MVYERSRNALFRFLPPACLLCGVRALPAYNLCRGCLADLPRINAPCPRCGAEAGGRICGACATGNPPFAGCVTATRYAWPVDQLVVRLKYHEQLAAAQALGRLLADAALAEERPDALIPLPLHRARQRRRGFNQAAEVALVAAAALELPVRRGLLERQHPTAEQAGLGRRARLQNVRGSFRAGPGCSGLHVALVDDVMTTGATMSAAADALLAAGAARVEAWCAARALAGPS